MEQFNNLIINLITVQLVANDIHYLCHGEAFYGKHIFVDEIKFNDEIDSIKEVCLLGRGIRPLQNVEYYKAYVLEKALTLDERNDKANFIKLQETIEKALNVIDSLKDLSRGEENLIGNIAEKLQKFKGLLNLQIED